MDEQWIPVSCAGRVSLRQIFGDPAGSAGLERLGGDPVSKIAVFKLLLAIAQAAATPKSMDDWEKLGTGGLSARVHAYLDKWHDSFYLFGDRPFLQFPQIKSDKILSQAALLPYIATGNTTVLTQTQNARELSAPESAVLLVTQMSMCFSGKKADKSVSLTPGYKKKSAPYGPGLGIAGFLHSFITGSSILESVYLNLITAEELSGIRTFEGGLGIAPWERMPEGEDDEIDRDLRSSYMGRLVPMARFALLMGSGIYLTEGIRHPGYQEGVCDPSITVSSTAQKKDGTKDYKVLWTDPAKKPWRELPAILSFIDGSSPDAGCLQLKLGFEKLAVLHRNFGIWSGGVRVKNNAGEQFVTGRNDYVDSYIEFPDCVDLGRYYAKYCSEAKDLDKLSSCVYSAVKAYYMALGIDDPSPYGAAAAEDFWELCGSYSQQLMNAVFSDDNDTLTSLRKKFGAFALSVYGDRCQDGSARRIKAKYMNRPRIGWYLRDGSGK